MTEDIHPRKQQQDKASWIVKTTQPMNEKIIIEDNYLTKCTLQQSTADQDH